MIPKQLRDELGIEPGDEVTFWRDDDHVALRPAHRAPRRCADDSSRPGLSDVLAAERRADRRRER